MTNRPATSRRRFLASLAGGALTAAIPGARGASRAPRRAVLIQRSPLAGFQFHAAPALWPRLAAGDALTLVREPDNIHDGRAVRVDWRGHQLGYLPRDDNAAVAQMLDRGEDLRARIDRLDRAPSPWDRVELTVWLER